MIVAYRYVDVCCPSGGDCPRSCKVLASAHGSWDFRPRLRDSWPLYVGRAHIGYIRGYLVPDAPAVPIRTGEGWGRFVAWAEDGRPFLVWPTVSGISRSFVEAPPAVKLAFFYRVDPSFYARGDWFRVSILPAEKYPGSGRLVGEEFRIVEPEGDYLRLVGRGGDEHLAWDLVLGTLDTGEWVLMGEDGLYLAVREGDKVVVEEPYRGSVYDVRGPPYAPHIPVVPVKWVRERFRRAVEFAKRVGLFELRYRGECPYLYVPPVDPAYLLKWPLVLYKWEYRLAARPVFRGFARLREVDCGEVYGGARGAGAGG